VTREELAELVRRTVAERIEERLGAPEPVGPDTPLLGSESMLDSIAFVTLLLELEEQLADEGHDVELTTDAALSAERSPFRTVGSLTDHLAGTVLGDA
jgi:acyl carrier protein